MQETCQWIQVPGPGLRFTGTVTRTARASEPVGHWQYRSLSGSCQLGRPGHWHSGASHSMIQVQVRLRTAPSGSSAGESNFKVQVEACQCPGPTLKLSPAP
eukprot:574194-Rhodomonas_salina.1